MSEMGISQPGQPTRKSDYNQEHQRLGIMSPALLGERILPSQGIFLRLFQLCMVNGATNEQDHYMAKKSPDRRSQIHPASETHGRRSVFLGRAVEICLCEPRSCPFHKTGNSVSTLHRDLHREP